MEDYYSEACDLLRRVNKAKREELSLMSHALSDVQAVAPTKLTADEENNAAEVALLALRTKLSTCRAQLKVAEQFKLETIPNDSAVLLAAAKLWIRETLHRLTVQKTHLRQQLEDLQNQEEEITKALEVSKLVLESVQQKHEDALKNISEIHLNAIRKKKKQTEQIRRRCQMLRDEMRKAIATLFPPVPGCLNLYDFLRDLSVCRRGEYLPIPSNMWPPHLFELEQYGIIKRNPSDKRQVCLTDFSDGERD